MNELNTESEVPPPAESHTSVGDAPSESTDVSTSSGGERPDPAPPPADDPASQPVDDDEVAGAAATEGHGTSRQSDREPGTQVDSSEDAAHGDTTSSGQEGAEHALVDRGGALLETAGDPDDERGRLDAPEGSNDPRSPEGPEAPGDPDDPEVPDEPEEPDASKVPEVPDDPEQAGDPDDPEVPDYPENPDDSEGPNDPLDLPEESEYEGLDHPEEQNAETNSTGQESYYNAAAGERSRNAGLAESLTKQQRDVLVGLLQNHSGSHEGMKQTLGDNDLPALNHAAWRLTNSLKHPAKDSFYSDFKKTLTSEQREGLRHLDRGDKRDLYGTYTGFDSESIQAQNQRLDDYVRELWHGADPKQLAMALRITQDGELSPDVFRARLVELCDSSPHDAKPRSEEAIEDNSHREVAESASVLLRAISTGDEVDSEYCAQYIDQLSKVASDRYLFREVTTYTSDDPEAIGSSSVNPANLTKLSEGGGASPDRDSTLSQRRRYDGLVYLQPIAPNRGDAGTLGRDYFIHDGEIIVPRLDYEGIEVKEAQSRYYATDRGGRQQERIDDSLEPSLIIRAAGAWKRDESYESVYRIGRVDGEWVRVVLVTGRWGIEEDV